MRPPADAHQNCRFYGELAKFKVARPHAILHVLKVFLDDFRPNIENISNLLETCGRFLLRYEPTAAVAKDMVRLADCRRRRRLTTQLELIKRKQKLLNLDSRQQIMLENAFYQVRFTTSHGSLSADACSATLLRGLRERWWSCRQCTSSSSTCCTMCS